MKDDRYSAQRKINKSKERARKDYSEYSSSETDLVDRRHRHRHHRDRKKSKSRKDHKLRKRERIDESSSYERDKRGRDNYSDSDEKQRRYKSKSRSRKDDRHRKNRYRDDRRRISDEGSPIKKDRYKEKDKVDQKNNNERLKQERLARLRMLKYDEEYAGLINRHSDAEENEEAVNKNIEISKEHQELAEKLRIKPQYLVEQIKALEDHKEKQITEDTNAKTKSEKSQLNDDLLDPLEMDSHNMSFSSKRSAFKENGGDVDPLDEFMMNIERVDQQPFQLQQILEDYTTPVVGGKDKNKEEGKNKEEPRSIALFDISNQVPEDHDNEPNINENDKEAELEDNLKEKDDGSDGEDDFIKALKETDFDNPNVKQNLALNQQIKELNDPELFSDLSIEEQEHAKERINGDAQTNTDFFALVDKVKKKKEFETIHETKLHDDVKKNLYIESSEITAMTDEDVEEMRKQLGDIKIRGIDPIRPVWTWYHCGLSTKLLHVLVDKLGYKYPFPIQCQCIPIIMSGRDCIGIAETGSGKTLAYVLPLIKHIKAQKPLREGDGPIGIIMVPTRELASQVYSTAKLLGKAVGLRVAAIYGGAGVSGQLSELKKGVEIVVCTPGRMIDTLSLSGGKITNLKRISYVVIDEADRMFDMGFEPQLMKIISGVRLNRQVVMFSATFPKNVEALAKRILKKPLEVVVGTRGQICKNVDQAIHIIPEDKKLFKLLELLGIWLEMGNVLIFVDRKVDADQLYTQLIQYKYKPLLLHGGQDQADRESTMKDFTTKSKQVMIATSLVARGLDIPNIILVVNYSCPTFKEDYIHRIGRTGRAGRKGNAVTFVSPEEDRYAGDLIQALQISGSDIPVGLQQMHLDFRKKVQKGEEKAFKNKNLSGRGYKFDPEEVAKIKLVKKMLSKAYGLELNEEEEMDIEEMKRLEESKKLERENIKLIKDPKTREKVKRLAIKAASDAIVAGSSQEEVLIAAQNAVKNFLLQYNPEGGASTTKKDDLKVRSEVLTHDVVGDKYNAELDINDYPEATRKKVTSKAFLNQLSELTTTQISVRGILTKANAKNVFGQKKLHLFIEGENKMNVTNAIYEIKRICEESAMRTLV